MPADESSANKFGHLLNQVRWVTRLSVALSSAIAVDDVYSVLISGLISPMGLGYSHAILFEIDPFGTEMTGKLAVGLRSRQQAREIFAELESEMLFLEKQKSEMLENDDEDDAAEEMRTLELGSQWVTVFQRLGTENRVTQEITKLSFPLNPEPGSASSTKTIFQAAKNWRSPHLVSNTQESRLIPDSLRSFLNEQTAVVPLHTNKGLRSIIFLDRRMTHEPISREDIESLEWFATQGALALQNSELIYDLENAYKELKAVDQLKSNFLSIISHELRTPLTAITGFVDLILQSKVGPITDSQRNLLTRVAKNTGHLSNMVNDLIEIAEIEAEGMSDVNLVAIDPLSTLFSTLPKLEYRRRDNKVQVEPVFKGAVPNIICDERALERIYFHLLDNAVKFSPAGEKVVVEFEQQGESTLSISICDSGEGIPKEKRQRIFDEFYQIDNSLTRSHEGLGLGLAVTRILVQATRGEIRVKSTVGKGSRFTLVYPLADAVGSASRASRY